MNTSETQAAHWLNPFAPLRLGVSGFGFSRQGAKTQRTAQDFNVGLSVKTCPMEKLARKTHETLLGEIQGRAVRERVHGVEPVAVRRLDFVPELFEEALRGAGRSLLLVAPPEQASGDLQPGVRGQAYKTSDQSLDRVVKLIHGASSLPHESCRTKPGVL
jgi:hypothetical protein